MYSTSVSGSASSMLSNSSWGGSPRVSTAFSPPNPHITRDVMSHQELTCLVPREATKSRTLAGMRRLGGAT